jgi:hypothetical protein
MRSSNHSFSSNRPGTVLILTIVLLVLLALIGTAYISTTGNDRVTAQQHADNTQVDLLLEGARAIITDAIVSDRFGATGTFPVNGGGQIDRVILASRHPWLLDPTLPVSGANPPVWDSITFPLGDGPSRTIRVVENPVTGETLNLNLNNKRNYLFIPTTTVVAGQTVPALRIVQRTSPTTVIHPGFYAADADGDGIADSLLWRMPVGQIEGQTWFMAVRVIDHNSAVNVNTAFTQNYTGTPEPLPGAFPSHLDLGSVLDTGGAAPNDYEKLHRYRVNDTTGNPPYIHNLPVEDPTAANSSTPTARNDAPFNSPAEAFWMQFGRRIDNPGFNTTGYRYRSLGLGEHAALAYRFVLRNPAMSLSMLESLLPRSLLTAAVRISSYASTDVLTWFNDNFNFADTGVFDGRALRSMLVTHNAVANTIRANGTPRAEMLPWTTPIYRGVWSSTTGYTAGDYVEYKGLPFRARVNVTGGNAPPLNPAAWEYQPFTSTPTKASLNTATFAELYRAFWQVFADEANPAQPANPTAGMFKSSIRDPRPAVPPNTVPPISFAPDAMMFLRAAISAVNALDLRDADENITDRTIVLPMIENGTPTNVNVTLFGTERQPYITEVYVQTDTVTVNGAGANPNGYIAIELHNPYPFAIDIRECALLRMERKAATYGAANTLTVLADFNSLVESGTMKSNAVGTTLAATIIPAYGTLLLENYDAAGVDAAAARHRPISSGLPLGGPIDVSADPPGTARNYAFVPGLHAALDGEVVLVRPLFSNNENPRVTLFYDDPSVINTTGTRPASVLAQYAPLDSFDFTGIIVDLNFPRVAHYQRQADPSAGAGWKFVFPGFHVAGNDGSPSATRYLLDRSGGAGIAGNTWDVGNGGTEPPIGATTLGTTPTVSTASTYTNDFPPIQVANIGFAGLFPLNATTNAFPFGGFARNGDALQITFIGSYVVRRVPTAPSPPPPPEEIVDFNTITMDAAMAEDANDSNDADEQIGRFVPLGPISPAVTNDPYAFASRLFDFVTVQAPHDDYTPNADPSRYPVPGPGGEFRYPAPVLTRPAKLDPSQGRDDATAGVHGQININTASWRVLATLPLVIDSTTGNVDRVKTVELAKEIAFFRDRDGDPNTPGIQTPFGTFNSIFDLARVPDFNKDAAGNVPQNPPTSLGDWSPYSTPSTPADDLVFNDWEARYWNVIRLSNMITTRSDMFTCYVLIQGWQNPGSAGATLNTERRTGFVVDRTPTTPTDRTVRMSLFTQD